MHQQVNSTPSIAKLNYLCFFFMKLRLGWEIVVVGWDDKLGKEIKWGKCVIVWVEEVYMQN